jgi:hypothetical protein
LHDRDEGVFHVRLMARFGTAACADLRWRALRQDAAGV